MAAASSALAAPHDFNVPAEPVAQAIPEFARQAGVQIVAPTGQLHGVNSSNLRGRYEVRDALRILLQGTGLDVASDNGTLIVLRSPPQPAGGGGPAPASAGPTGDETRRVSEVEVIGTRIRNATPTSPVVTLDRGDLDRSGATTLQGVLAQSPQNYSGVNAASSRLSGGNTGLTSEIDLRGLGPQATLTLVNGRRVSSGAGDQGRAVDVGMIPLAAIQRVDILADGASALYGSDAIGGVVNIVLRRDFDGSETSLRRGWNVNGADDFTAAEVAGTHWGSGHVLLAAEHQEQDALRAAELGITSVNFTSRGGGDFRVSPFGAPGTVLPLGIFSGQPFSTLTGPGGAPVFSAALPAGSGRNLKLTDLRLNQSNPGDLVVTDLAPRQQSDSVYVTLEQDVGSVTLFADAAGARRKTVSRDTDVINDVLVPTTNAFTPFREPVLVAYDFKEFGPTRFRIDNEGWFADAGARGSLPFANGRWEVVATGSHDRSERLFDSIDFTALSPLLASSDPAKAFNPFGDGTGQSPGVRLPSVEMGFRAVTRLWSVAANLQGDLWTLPAGAVRFAAGAEHRDERLDGRGIEGSAGQVLFDNPSRTLSAVYGELYVPIVGGDHPAPLVRELALSVAGRFEHYSDFGDTTNPKIGVLWRPSDEVTLKANWGTSFRAPLLRELSQTATVLDNIPVFDPLNPGGPGVATTTLVIGGNPHLNPETARTYTVSAEYRPAWASGARLSAGYFNVDYKDRIRGLLDGLDITTLLSFQKALPPGIAVRDASGKLTQLNVININSATTRMAGLDLAADYGWSDPQLGAFDIRASATVVLEDKDQLIAGAPVLDLKGVVGSPAKWRSRLDLIWKKDPWAASVTVHHTDGLTNTNADPRIVSRSVDGQTTVDTQLSWRIPGDTVWTRGLSAQVGATNLFDAKAPFVDGPDNFGVDPRNFEIQGRTIYLRLVKALGGAAAR